MNFKSFTKIPWLIKFGLKNLKIEVISKVKKDYSDPYKLLISVTNSCNYKCKTCGIWGDKTNNFLSPKVIKKIISKYRNKLYFLSITGGEPFLEKEKLINFLIKIKEVNPNLKYISINTNCSYPQGVQELAETLLGRFPDLDLRIGLHYIPNKEWGTKKTGRKDAYENYKKTESLLEKISKERKGFSFYKIITLSKKEDFKFIKKERNLWINFAVVNDFYKNKGNDYIENLTKEEKLEALNKYLELNKKNIGLLAKLFFFNLKRILKGERKRKCFAGINRIYIDSQGKEFICVKKIKNRKQMSAFFCKDCWTACEGNFDLVASFFNYPLINSQKKDWGN